MRQFTVSVWQQRDRYVQCCLCADREDPTGAGAVLGYVIEMPVVLHVKVVITVVAQRPFPLVQ